MASVFLNQWRFEQYVEVAREIEQERVCGMVCARSLIGRIKPTFGHNVLSWVFGRERPV